MKFSYLRDTFTKPGATNHSASKIVEHILLEAKSRHMDDREMIKESQYEFIKDKLCLGSLAIFYGGWWLKE